MNNIFENIVTGAVAGLVASFVLGGFNIFFQWLNRPIFKAKRANLKSQSPNGLLIFFDLFFTNEGKSSFFEPLINVDGLTSTAVEFVSPKMVDENLVKHTNATWSPEGNKIIYNHQNSFLPKTSFRLSFKVKDITKLPDEITVLLIHRNGIEKSAKINLADLKK